MAFRVPEVTTVPENVLATDFTRVPVRVTVLEKVFPMLFERVPDKETVPWISIKITRITAIVPEVTTVPEKVLVTDFERVPVRLAVCEKVFPMLLERVPDKAMVA